MSNNVKRLQADVVIVGGGPGGCIMARDLSKKGKKVVLIEKGGNDTRYFGSPIGMFLGGHMERNAKGGFPTTKEGYPLILGIGVGGGTKLYSGIAGPPGIEAFKNFGIDLSPYVDEARKDTWVSETPDEFIGPATWRLRESALEAGLPFEEKMLHHIDYNKCQEGCTLCGSGCKRGAKWTGKVPADEAVKHGATLLAHTKAKDIIVENGKAVGIIAKGRDAQYEVQGNAVVCCSGGIGTTPLLKRAGIYEAGSWFVADPSILMFGFLKEGQGAGYEHQMVFGGFDEEHGALLWGGIGTPFFTWFTMHLQSVGLKAFRDIRRYRKVLGIIVKLHDDDNGRVDLNERVSKTFTAADLMKEDYAKIVMEKALVHGGCNPEEIYASKKVLGHPGGTAPIGKLVDTNLETQINNLYCCDTSIMPEAPGRPPTWTIVTLAKRLAERLENIV
jgi:choline dehydrogenase-like flavoprotein